MREKTMYYTDEPISKPQDDAFGRNFFVDNLSNDIIHWKGDGSLVLALFGPWGSGKSSVLNLLKRALESEKAAKIIPFDPWYFNSTEQLIQTFFTIVKNETMASASNKDSKHGLDNAFKKYRIVLSNYVSWEPEIELPMGFKLKLGNLEKKFQEPDNPENIRAELRVALKKLEQKFIVLIDNLDRLDPPELLLMFKLVRLCSDFPHFVFVLAFDHKQVQKLIQKQGVDPDFLAKIVQVDIELPIIDQDQIDNFIFENFKGIIKNSGAEISQSSWDRFAKGYNQLISGQLIDDLRKAKRYLNSIGFTLSLVRENVDFADFMILEALRVFYPHIYSGLATRKKDLSGFDYGQAIDVFRKQKLSAFQDIRDWVGMELLEKANFQNCEHLLGFLFPQFNSYLQSPGNPSIIVQNDEFIAQQRICVPEYFDNYFKFRIPKGEIPARVINDIVELLNSSSNEATQITIRLILGEKHRLSQLLKKLNFHINNLTLTGRGNFIYVLGEIGDQLDWKLLNSWNSSGSFATHLIIRCLDLSENNLGVLTSVINVISSTTSLALASDLIMDLFSPDRPTRKLPQSNYDNLKSIMIARLHKELLQDNQNIFISYPTAFYKIITIWRSMQILAEQEIATKYVYEQLSADSNALPKLLIMYSTIDGNLTTLRNLDIEKIKKEYDAQKLIEILEKQESIATYTEFDNQVINKFKNLMNAERNKENSS
jgi:energy-coupling factor transporter ATP-binding protein EcfA2